MLTGGLDASETSKFAMMMDKFFDSVNVHNYKHGLHARKQYQMPYTVHFSQRQEIEGNKLNNL